MAVEQDRPTYHHGLLLFSRPDDREGTLILGHFHAWRAVSDELAVDIAEDVTIGRKPVPADPQKVCTRAKFQQVVNLKVHFEVRCCARSTILTRKDSGESGSLRGDIVHVGNRRHAKRQGALADNLGCLLARLEQVVATEPYLPVDS